MKEVKVSVIDHDEAMIQSWMRHPEHAKSA